MRLESARQRFEMALEGLYSAFSPYPFRADMPCCVPHCFFQSEIDTLGAQPLRSLKQSKLSSFAFSLLLTCGEVEDFKHFLPRLFELTATEGLGHTDAEISIGKLHRADWRNWPEPEQMAVSAFLLAWWRLELERGVNHSLEKCFSALCCADNDPQGYLEIWRNSGVTRHAVSLAKFINYNLTMILIGHSFNTWVGHKATGVVKEFLREPATRARLEQAFFECDDPNDRDTLSFAEQLLR